MQQAGVLNIENAGRVPERRWRVFWRRQFLPEHTGPQTVFDVLLGVVLPVLCFIFDPLVFRGGMGGRPFFPGLQLMAYSIAFIEIFMLLSWLCARRRLGAHVVSVGGFLMAGALVSLIIGIVLFPLSLIGILLFGIGLLGFIPFLTAFVYWRNSLRAINLRHEQASIRRKLAALVLGLVFVLGLPVALHLKITQAVEQSLATLSAGDEMDAAEAIERLRLLSYFGEADTDKIVWAYNNEQDAAKRERLAGAYFLITGQYIERRRTFLLD
jgi:hypothetical protein